MPESEEQAISEDLSFEEALERLEEIVELLDGEPDDLDEALKQYEEGVALARHCMNRLEQTELRVQELSLED